MSTSSAESVNDGMIRAEPRQAPAPGAPASRAIPPEIEQRYRCDGTRLMFPDGAPAIEDRGERLIARTGNAQVARDLVAIAQSRGWDRISSRGTEAFRTEIARAASRQGIEVADGPRAGHTTAARVVPAEPDVQPEAAAPTERQSRIRRSTRKVGDLMTGVLVEAGKAPYRFDPGNTPSFYLRIETERGTRDLWGSQLREALYDSWTFPQPGERIGVQFLGTQAVRGDSSPAAGEAKRRNLWRVERIAFFEQRARDAAAIRAGGLDLSQPDSITPNATDAAAILRAADVFASARIAASADRERFVQAVRDTLATTLEQGGRLPDVRLRDRQPPAQRTRRIEPTTPTPSPAR